jgi:hypothetical protein
LSTDFTDLRKVFKQKIWEICGTFVFFIPLGLNTPPLGAVKTGGAGDLFPRIRKDFKGKSSIPRRLRRGFLFA